MRLPIRSSHHIILLTCRILPCPFRLSTLSIHVTSTSASKSAVLISVSSSLSRVVFIFEGRFSSHISAALHASSPFPDPTLLHTSSALYRLRTNIHTAHAVVSRPFRLSLHALAISPLALISRALCLLNETLPPSLPSCLRAFRPSTLVVTSTRNPAGARAFTCALQTSHPSPDSFISVLTPSHTPSGHRLSGRVTSDLRHQTHACANFRVESCAPFGTHYIPALSW